MRKESSLKSIVRRAFIIGLSLTVAITVMGFLKLLKWLKDNPVEFFQGTAVTVVGQNARHQYLREHGISSSSSKAVGFPGIEADWRVRDSGGPGGYLWYASFRCSSIEACFHLLQASASFGETTSPEHIEELELWGDDITGIESVLRNSTWPDFSDKPNNVTNGCLFAKFRGGDCYLFLIDIDTFRCYEHRQTGGILIK